MMRDDMNISDAGAPPVAWARITVGSDGRVEIEQCDPDDDGARPIFTHPTPPRASVAASDEPGAVPLIERSREWWAARAEREGSAVISAGAPDVSSSTIPRRIQLNRFTAAERAIYDAVQVVEAAGADVRLTDAVVLLQAARDSVADFVDGIDSRRYVAAPRADATRDAFVCGGTGTIPPAAQAELNDFETYLRLKARFDATRNAARRGEDEFIGEPITATDWHAKAQQLAEENVALREQINAFRNQPIKAWAVVRDDDNDVLLFVLKDEVDAVYWVLEGATTRPLVFAAMRASDGVGGEG